MNWFHIQGDQYYQPFETAITGDFSSATFPLCAAAVTGSSILIKGLDFNDEQGDREVFNILQSMGVKMVNHDKGITVNGEQLQGMELDLNDIPDALPALAVVGCFARGRTILRNVKQARLKECDRIAAAVTELKKMGADIRELADGIEVCESRLSGTMLHGYHDHRMVMALAIAGLASAGETIIDSAEAIGVTYPTFIDDIKSLGGRIDFI
jgi:3-phosphoshikimate 1-carboxyvinyltransferase